MNTHTHTALQSAADILVEEVDVSAHTLVLGLPASADGLLTLLAALRSKRLLHWRPVVIVDSKPPGGGGTWEAVAQFRDVYFIEVGLKVIRVQRKVEGRERCDRTARKQTVNGKSTSLLCAREDKQKLPADGLGGTQAAVAKAALACLFGADDGANSWCVFAWLWCVVQVRDGLNDALLRASAERAAQAILMTPLTMQQQDGEDHRLASKVMTGMRAC